MGAFYYQDPSTGEYKKLGEPVALEVTEDPEVEVIPLINLSGTMTFTANLEPVIIVDAEYKEVT